MSAAPNAQVSALELIRKIAAELIADRDLSITLQAVTKLVVEFLPADHCAITLLDGREQFFRIEAEYPATSPSLVGEKITIANRPTQSALLNSAEPIIATSRNHPIFAEENFLDVALRIDIQALVIVPIVLRHGTIGTLSIDSIGRPREFTPSEVELCRAIAADVALAAENQRLRQVRAILPNDGSLLRFGENLRVDDVSRKLLEKLRSQVEFRKASVQLIADGKRTLVAWHGFDNSKVDARLLRPIDSDPLIHRAVLSGKPLILADTQDIAGWDNGAEGVRSWMAIPLMYNGTAVGIVTLDHDEPGFYGHLQDGVRVRIEEIASRSAMEIQNTYEHAAARRLEFGYQIADLAAKLDMDALLPRMTETIARGFSCTRSGVFFLESQDARPRLRQKETFPESKRYLALEKRSGGTPITAEDYLWAALENSQYAKDIPLPDKRGPGADVFRTVRSMIAVPLKIASRPKGVIFAGHDESNGFGEGDLFLLETAARYVASAIEWSEGLKYIHSIGGDIFGASRTVGNEIQGGAPLVGLPKSLLEKIVTGAMNLTHSDYGVIYLFNDGATAVIDTFIVGGSIHPTPRLENREGITNWVLKYKKILEIPDISEDKRVNPKLRPLYRSMFAAPLLFPARAGTSPKVVGVLYLNGGTVRKLTPIERSLLETLAGQAASVIQRERLHQQLVRSEAVYHSLVDNIPHYVMRKDTDSRFVSANASFCESLGKSLAEIVNKCDADFYGAEDAAKFVSDDQKVMKDRAAKHLEERHRLPRTGQVIDVKVTKTPVIEDGVVTGVQAIFEDITEQKETEERYRSLVEHAPYSIVVHKGGKIHLVNPAARYLFGVNSEEELRNRSILDFVDERDKPMAAVRLDKLMKKEPVEPKVRMKIRNLKDKVIETDVYAWPGPGENEVQVVLHDLSFLADMHHRAKRPLTYADNILKQAISLGNIADPEALRVIESLRRQVQAMANIHLILEDQSAPDVDMHLYLSGLIREVEKAYETPGVKVTRNIQHLPMDEIRANACGVITAELVSNAFMHAFPDHCGTIKVSLRLDRRNIRLRVEDNGTGMPPVVRPRATGLDLVDSYVRMVLKGKLNLVSGAPGACYEIVFSR